MNQRILTACDAVMDACERLGTAMTELRAALADAGPCDLRPGDAIDFHSWPIRSHKALHYAGIVTWQDLCRQTETSLLKLKNFGEFSLWDVKKRLNERGLCLGMVPNGT